MTPAGSALSRNGKSASRRTAVPPSQDHIAAAVGFRLGEHAYIMDGLRTSLLLQATVLLPESGSRQRAVEAAAVSRDKMQTGSIHDLHGADKGSMPGSVRSAIEDIQVPLSAILTHVPEPGRATRFWDSLSDAAPERFGRAKLQERHRALRRVKAC